MSYKIIAKYIKDIKFQIADSRSFFLLSKNISNYNLNIDIKSNQVKEKIIEVQTTLSLSPIKDNFEKINTKIVYSTIIEITDEITDKKEIEKIILINVPSEIYPEVRRIFVFIFENSGFKEIKINKTVDFEKLYNLRKVQ